METQIIITNMPNRDIAIQLANRLVDTGLAACVNLLAPCTSVYSWRGKTETAQEVPLMIKTTARCHTTLEALLLELRPYELPEIIATPGTAGHIPYLDWITAATVRSGEAVNVD